MASNPFGFTKGPVTFWLVAVYAAFIIPLVYVHESVPSIPKHLPDGLNMTEAWLDLSIISSAYHPYNSRANDEVGAFLLKRIEEILDCNKVQWSKETGTGGVVWPKYIVNVTKTPGQTAARTSSVSIGSTVTVFDETTSNVTFTGISRPLGSALGGNELNGVTYFEGTNKIVYIRGSQDPDGEWWKKPDPKNIGKGGVLVNAHYDSVSTGYGATDDGMGVASILQMVRYFTTPGRQPERGIVLLFNNGEEDGLYGAKAFHYSPFYHFTTSFVNLEGAGAGGRAILFRTTDLQAAKAYRKAPHPFGSIVADDGFKLGAIKSETDYRVWADFGMRGLDIAFYRPRARYHTNQDDARHASRESLWHMLSNSLAAVEALEKDLTTFKGDPPGGDTRKVSSGSGSHGVWFDMFGEGFAALNITGLFAWCVTLLVVSPLILFAASYIIAAQGKYYFFSHKFTPLSGETITLGGWKGFFRFPIALIISGGLTFAGALLIHKINPHIVYSSDYGVWATTSSVFFIVFWTISKGASAVRPSALQRGYAHIWLFILSWALLIVATVYADRQSIGSGYLVAFLHSAIFVSTVVAVLELGALPSKTVYAARANADQELPDSDALRSPRANEGDDEPTERTPLRSGEAGNNGTMGTTFATTYRRSLSAITRHDADGETKDTRPSSQEQPWSAKLPSWTWFLQLLLLAPITIVIFLQVALFAVSATHTTSSDVGDAKVVYLGIALFTILVLLPITPFVHRASFYLPLFLLLVLITSLIYNLVAFPFSANNRYKVYFVQDLDLTTAESSVRVTGVEEYVRKIIAEVPSASGKHIECSNGARGSLSECSYNASSVLPKLTPSLVFGDFAKQKYAGLVTVETTSNSSTSASLRIDAEESKECEIIFGGSLESVNVRGSAGIDPLLSKPLPKGNLRHATLWRRDLSKPWVVDIKWQPGAVWGNRPAYLPSERHAMITCQWSDVNTRGVIPAFDEIVQFAPDWAAITKGTVGLVRGHKVFEYNSKSSDDELSQDS
ncbi:Vacuolar membrane protease [Colletotrichum chlorophyti]|uniref:Peptide hydrolase n=1 Tax=Colletotrichum chlorophyti TaxID=708187 RepID=A0A1Q8RX46_9PEZI|nr:Vacuolar membrane protease [Colletotrichum chlorophyti]